MQEFDKSVCKRWRPEEITPLNPSGNPLFTVSSTEKTDKIWIPSALLLHRRQCNCGEFYLVSKLAASTTGTIKLTYCTVAIAARINAEQASTKSHRHFRIMLLKMLMLMAVSCLLTWRSSSKTKSAVKMWWKKSDRHRCNTWECKSKLKTRSNPQNRERSG